MQLYFRWSSFFASPQSVHSSLLIVSPATISALSARAPAARTLPAAVTPTTATPQLHQQRTPPELPRLTIPQHSLSQHLLSVGARAPARPPTLQFSRRKRLARRRPKASAAIFQGPRIAARQSLPLAQDPASQKPASPQERKPAVTRCAA